MQIVFVHGAFVRDGAWWWQPAARLIEAATGVRSTAVQLPSCGEGGVTGTTAGLVEDAAELGAVLDEVGPAIVVAHSYGGTVVAEGGGHPNTRHLVYISSFLPEVGQTHADLVPPSADPVPIRVEPDGRISVDNGDREYFDRRFLHDVADTDLIEQAHARLQPQNPAALGTPTTAAAWKSIPSTYLVCADDRSTDPELQRFHAAKATGTIELPTAHHPFLSRPDLVGAPLGALIRQL